MLLDAADLTLVQGRAPPESYMYRVVQYMPTTLCILL